MLPSIFVLFTVLNTIAPPVLSLFLAKTFHPTTQQYSLIKSFSLLLLGLFLSSLATLNFSLAFLVGLFSAPLTYMQPLPNRPIVASILTLLLTALAPTTVLLAGATYWGLGVGEVLKEAAFGWDVWAMNTQVVVWCVWWPAWLVGVLLVYGRPKDETREVKDVKS
jgi:glycosylphosphatidylinositol transamidase